MKTLEEKTTHKDLEVYTDYFSKIAQEEVRIFVKGNHLYAFGSETGCLRIAFQHRHENIEVNNGGPMAGWYFVSKDHHETRLLYAVQNLETIMDSALNNSSEVISLPNKLAIQRILQNCTNIVEELETYPF